MIDKDLKDKVIAAADIVDVIGEFVELKKSGNGYVGLCPFHNDTNPSMTVSPMRGTYKCFACGEGGDVITFLMKKEMMSFPEAVEWLANRYGIDIPHPKQTREQWRRRNELESMYAINELAMHYYEDVLANQPEGEEGREFFRKRGITGEMVKRFHLGYAPLNGTLMGYVLKADQGIKHMFRSGDDVKFKSGKTLHVVNGVGLIFQKENGLFVERCSHRVIFPQHNTNGQVVSFGARVLDDATKGIRQKYINSPDSLVFSKGEELYGLYQSKRDIATSNNVYIVEGYMDVISMHQCGITNVVANMGTAMTDSQAHILKRLTENVTLLYDSDQAGMNATIRSIGILLFAGLNVYVVALPDGEDPDSFCHTHNGENVKSYMESNRQSFVEYMCHALLKDASDPVQQTQAIRTILSCIDSIQDNIKHALFIKHLARVSGLSEDLLVTG